MRSTGTPAAVARATSCKHAGSQASGTVWIPKSRHRVGGRRFRGSTFTVRLPRAEPPVLDTDTSVGCVTGLIMPLELDTHAQLFAEHWWGYSKGFTRCVFDIDGRRPSDALFPYDAGSFGSGDAAANNQGITFDVFAKLKPSGTFGCRMPWRPATAQVGLFGIF